MRVVAICLMMLVMTLSDCDKFPEKCAMNKCKDRIMDCEKNDACKTAIKSLDDCKDVNSQQDAIDCVKNTKNELLIEAFKCVINQCCDNNFTALDVLMAEGFKLEQTTTEPVSLAVHSVKNCLNRCQTGDACAPCQKCHENKKPASLIWHTSSLQYAGGGAVTYSFMIHGEWTPWETLFSNVSDGHTVTKQISNVSHWPSKFRVMGGHNAVLMEKIELVSPTGQKETIIDITKDPKYSRSNCVSTNTKNRKG